MTDEKTRVRFPNLDALRFLCFASVFFFHSFATKFTEINTSDQYHFIKSRLLGNGNLGVNFFFVLSGFLITYLLLVEKSKFNGIHFGLFYTRRILKIWPMFAFCVVFGFFVFPIFKSFFHQTPNETAHLLGYLTFTNNFDFMKHGADSSVISVLWSVAIEEQFYLVWPLIIALSPRKFLPFVFGTIIIGSFLFRLWNAGNAQVLEMHTFSCISDLSVGGLAAFLCFTSKAFIRTIQNIRMPTIALLYLCTGLIYFYRKEIFFGNSVLIAIDRLVVSFLFALIILEQIYCINSLFKIGRLKLISRLGEYTYGLYCLHMIGILIAATLLDRLALNRSLWQIIIFEGGLSFLITIGLGILSFKYYETPFLKLKERFAVVRTSHPDKKPEYAPKSAETV
jgi:peptidoglycan/LPS O-acetylase OafA/YrhL